MKTRTKKKARKAKAANSQPFSTDIGVSNVASSIGLFRVGIDSDREQKRVIIDTIRKLADLL